MDIPGYIHLFSVLDAIALALLVASAIAIGWRIDRLDTPHQSVAVLMGAYRREWMRQFVSRQPRIFDANIIDSLRQGTSFFASACMIAIGGGLALLGNSERLLGLAQDLTLETAPVVVLEVKILVVILFISDAFLKFVWAHRLFGYCAIVMAAVPNQPEDPLAYARAEQAADINISAARSFNRGLRSVYFSLAALAWILGAVPLLVATAMAVLVLWRREFASNSRAVILKGMPGR
ncbi:DUF599 domain-containing protein [Plastorhodobacter daqingensis]|uniref:DUF599 domain-containing protein n=1 Tax=Plastorhodobacter daqingensis TaxID=1387281 RepID=A0ABW2UGF3_9RHOB